MLFEEENKSTKETNSMKMYRTHSTHTVQQHFGQGNLYKHMQPYQVRLTSFFRWRGIAKRIPDATSLALPDMLTRQECRISVAKGGKNVSHQVSFQNVQYIAVNNWRNSRTRTWENKTWQAKYLTISALTLDGTTVKFSRLCLSNNVSRRNRHDKFFGRLWRKIQ